jgi:enoyl-CoA hydratase
MLADMLVREPGQPAVNFTASSKRWQPAVGFSSKLVVFLSPVWPASHPTDGQKTRGNNMAKVIYEKDGRIARITLNRPDVMNAIDHDLPSELSAAVAEANAGSDIHVIVLSGAGRAFCAGYDLTAYAEATDGDGVTQDMPWDPMKDYAMMMGNTEHFMSLWKSYRPVIAKVHGFAVAGGSDIALCSDLVVMAEDAQIGYMPARVWGCPTTAMWVYRLGAEQAKRMLLTGDKIDGKEAERIGLIHKAVTADQLDDEVERLAERIAGVPINQLMMQKMMINQAIEAMGLQQTQQLATIFDGITRHSPEGMNFKHRSENVGWKQAVDERDRGTYDWTEDRPINAPK